MPSVEAWAGLIKIGNLATFQFPYKGLLFTKYSKGGSSLFILESFLFFLGTIIPSPPRGNHVFNVFRDILSANPVI